MAPKKFQPGKAAKAKANKKDTKRPAVNPPELPPATKRKPEALKDLEVVPIAPPPACKPVALDRKAISGMLTALKYAADPFFERPGRKEAQQALEVLCILNYMHSSK
jgi:hypothetical protein